jgi:hypothetical protein
VFRDAKDFFNSIGTKAKCRLHRGMSEFEVQSGKHMLVLSSSQFDPYATSARIRVAVAKPVSDTHQSDHLSR